MGRLPRDDVCINPWGDLGVRMTELRRHPGEVRTGCERKAREGVPGVVEPKRSYAGGWARRRRRSLVRPRFRS
jgi:hypothetical protein